ncbi:hypothetical protein FB446DRAFT_795552, partial [Lentinula raphanica]
MEDSSTPSSSPNAQPPPSSPNLASASASSQPTVQQPDASELTPPAPLLPANTVPQTSTTKEKAKRSQKRGNPGKFQGEHL